MKTDEEICYIIGDWYLQWKDILVNWDNQTHSFGFAKEHLKMLLCEPEIEEMEE